MIAALFVLLLAAEPQYSGDLLQVQPSYIMWTDSAGSVHSSNRSSVPPDAKACAGRDPCCVRCARAKRKYLVYQAGCTQTLMAVTSYYDTNGTFRYHDPNTITCSYQCDLGHTWSREPVPFGGVTGITTP